MASLKRVSDGDVHVHFPKRRKLFMEPQGRFILGSDLSTSSDSSRSPIKSRWSKSNTRKSPTKSPFTQIRNHSYVLSLSPRQSPGKSRKNTGGNKRRRIVDFTAVGQDKLNTSLTSGERSGEDMSSKAPKPRERRKHLSTKSYRRKSDAVESDAVVTAETLSCLRSDTAKWTPIQNTAKSMLLDSIAYSSSLIGLSKYHRKSVEEQMDRVVTRLRDELATATATAPRTGRLKSYSNLISSIKTSKSDYLTVVEHNKELHQKLENLECVAKDKLEKVKNISNLHDEELMVESFKDPSIKDWNPESGRTFSDYLIELIDGGRQSLI